MRPRGFHRSRLFWLGVPGVVFLLWAWWDSGGYVSSVGYERGRVLRQVEVSHGSVVWTYALDLASPGSVGRIPMVGRGVLAGEDGSLGRRGFDLGPVFERKGKLVEMPAFGIVRSVSTVSVGMWVVVLGYAVVWLGAVVWWQRRQMRVRRGLTEMGTEREVAE